jgi:predicted DNA-binding protein
MGHRINARLDEELARKVEELSKLTGKNASAVIKAALEAYYERMRSGDLSARAALERAGFIGCSRGEADLSTGYKASLSRSLGKKT